MIRPLSPATRFLAGSMFAVLVALSFWGAGCVRNDGLSTKVDLAGNKGYKYSLKFLKEKDERASSKSVVMTAMDPVGDDRGPGTYQYPLMSQFEKGAFDLTYFEVAVDGDFVVFTIGVMGRTRPGLIDTRFGDSSRISFRKWDLQLFDIYIDKDREPGSGETRTLPGRSVSFDPEYAWEQVVVVSPMPPREVTDLLKRKSEIIALSDLESKIVIPGNITVSDNKFVIRVSKETLGEPAETWAYQVFSMGYEEYDTKENFMNKSIHSFADNWGFGGGTDFLGDPNVIDILVPKGSDQYKVLSDYVSNPDPRRNRYARVPMVTKADAQN